MMNIVTAAKVKQLQKVRANPCISMYMPMQSGLENAERNRITYKNALRVAKRMVRSDSMPLRVRRDRVWEKQADKLLRNSKLWEAQARGLAVFITDDSIGTFRVEHTLEPRIYVGLQFVTEPLVTAKAGVGRVYYALALSKGATRLFEFKGKESREIGVSTIPHELSSSLQLDEPDKSLQTHMVGHGGTKGSEAFHGQGYYKDQRKILMEKFLRRVANKVNDVLAKKDAPLFIIGTSPVVARYKKFNTYKHLVQANLYRNVDKLTASQIRRLLLANNSVAKGGLT